MPRFASAACITRLSPDPNKRMAGRCPQGLIDVLEGNYGGDIYVFSEFSLNGLRVTNSSSHPLEL